MIFREMAEERISGKCQRKEFQGSARGKNFREVAEK